MVERVARGGISDQDLRARLERAGLLNELKQGNIDEILLHLPETTIEDVKAFLASQHRSFASNIEQTERVFSENGEARPPLPTDIPPFDDKAALDESDCDMLRKGFKAAKAGGVSKSAGKAQTTSRASLMTEEELYDSAEGALQDYEDLVNQITRDIGMQQFQAEYEKRKEEIMRGVREIIALAKSGKIDATFVILALTKVKVMEDGHIAGMLAKKGADTNENMNRISNEIYGKGDVDYGKIQIGANTLRSEAYDLQQITSTLQSVFNKIEGAVTFCDSTIKYLNSVKREMINKWGH